MGPASARRKRANPGQMQAAAGPIPGPAICPRLINPAAFDKVKPRASRDVPTDLMKAAGFPNITFNTRSTSACDNLRMHAAMALDVPFAKDLNVGRVAKIRPRIRNKKARPQWPGS
jgi:hypothetical protein